MCAMKADILLPFPNKAPPRLILRLLKMLDAISRLEDCSGEDADATSAYTQSHLGGPDTWVRLPRDQWPAHWSRYKDPVCRLRLSLYGHPLAGIYWEKIVENTSCNVVFVPVKGWECLFVNYQAQLFLSIYVDDFNMAGKSKILKRMWERLGQTIDLDPPVPLDGDVYLGCGQHDVDLPSSIIYANGFMDTRSSKG